MPRRSNLLGLNLTLKIPNINPAITAAILEKVTNWLAVAIEMVFAEPKNSVAISTKYNPVRSSITYAEKNARVNDGTKSFPGEFLLIEFCSNLYPH